MSLAQKQRPPAHHTDTRKDKIGDAVENFREKAEDIAGDAVPKIADGVGAAKDKVSEEDYMRARYVIGEKQRVLDVCDALERGDFETVGRCMYETHHGLSKDYEVSCEELDFLNDIACECGVTGSRIMGGGFGGCTINLVKDELYDNFIATAKAKFNEKYGHEPVVYPVIISDGAHKCEA